MISQLITLATLPDGASSETKIEEISDAARSTLNKLISGMSVVDFSESVQSMLQSGNVKVRACHEILQLISNNLAQVQAGALELLAKRLPDVSTKMRPAISNSVTKALASVKDILSTRKEPQVIVNALQAIKSIATTTSSGEESALADLVPLVISASKEKDAALAALGALAAMSYVVRYVFFFCWSDVFQGSNLDLASFLSSGRLYHRALLSFEITTQASSCPLCLNGVLTTANSFIRTCLFYPSWFIINHTNILGK